MNLPAVHVKRIPKMTMLFAGGKCLYQIVHFQREEEKNEGSFKPGFYIVPTCFATATIVQRLENRRFRSQKRAVDFCKSALKSFHKMIYETEL